jgi:hypothetical protein
MIAGACIFAILTPVWVLLVLYTQIGRHEAQKYPRRPCVLRYPYIGWQEVQKYNRRLR